MTRTKMVRRARPESAHKDWLPEGYEGIDRMRQAMPSSGKARRGKFWMARLYPPNDGALRARLRRLRGR